MTVSHWMRTYGPGPRHHRSDAVVIGGGVVGLSAALELARRGLKVRLVERGVIGGTGSGASTRNAGFLMRGCADHYADAVKQYGRERARALWTMTEDNLRELRREGVDKLTSFRERPSCLVALDEAQRHELAQAHALLIEDDFTSGWLEAKDGEDTVFAKGRGAGLAGLVNAGDATVNPAEMIGLLRRKAADAGVEMHEHIEICGVEGDERQARVVAARDVFEASWAVVCTNAYGPALVPGLGKLLTPRRGQMLAMERGERRLDFAYYANHGSEYFREADEGAIVVGGCRTYFADVEVGTDDVTTTPVQNALEAFASRVLGGVPRVTARWAGIMAFTPDGLPIVGPAPGVGSSCVWAISACTGHGMSMGFRTARMGVGEMLGGEASGFAMSRFG